MPPVSCNTTILSTTILSIPSATVLFLDISPRRFPPPILESVSHGASQVGASPEPGRTLTVTSPDPRRCLAVDNFGGRATPKPHQCDIKATLRRTDSQAIGTPRPPASHPEATPKRALEHRLFILRSLEPIVGSWRIAGVQLVGRWRP